VRRQWTIVRRSFPVDHEQRRVVRRSWTIVHCSFRSHRCSFRIDEVQRTIRNRSRTVLHRSFRTEKEQRTVLREQRTIEKVSRTFLHERWTTLHPSFSIRKEQRTTRNRSRTIDHRSLPTRKERRTIVRCLLSMVRERRTFLPRRFAWLFRTRALHQEERGTEDEHRRQGNSPRHLLLRRSREVAVKGQYVERRCSRHHVPGQPRNAPELSGDSIGVRFPRLLGPRHSGTPRAPAQSAQCSECYPLTRCSETAP
jgi:hypothetical protein